jgi:acetyl esterase/lipase
MQTIVNAQTEISLYPEGVPNSIKIQNREYIKKGNDGKLRVHNITIPTLTIFEAPKEKANGTSIIICPGGGYSIVAISHEGFDVARQFNDMGVTAFVLKYRMPNDSTMVDKTIGPLQDAQRAVQYVRENAKHWHLDKHTIGLLGFSAGGHLASTEATHFKKSFIGNKKDQPSSDYLVLIYPVISFTDSLMHKGSRDNLIGRDPSAETTQLYSNELQVSKETPPTFLVHAKDDGGVKYQNSTAFYDALKRNDVKTDIYLFEKGGHGFGLNNPTSDVKWVDLVRQWMDSNGWLKRK